MSRKDINLMIDKLSINEEDYEVNNICNNMNSLNMTEKNIYDMDTEYEEEDIDKCIEERKNAGMYGIPNRFSTSVDDEDFIYKTLILPQCIFNELNNSVPFNEDKFDGYEEYFGMFCQNSEDIFLSADNTYEIAKIFDTMFDKRIINYDYCYDVINKTLSELNEFEISYESDEYLTFDIKELLYGLRIIINKLNYLIEHYNSWYNDEMMRLLNNYCVICIYLVFYFETNIFIDNNDKISFS